MRRFVNAFSFSMLGLTEFVDHLDLLLLEALRMFDPNAYYFVRRNLESLVG